LKPHEIAFYRLLGKISEFGGVESFLEKFVRNCQEKLRSVVASVGLHSGFRRYKGHDAGGVKSAPCCCCVR
jgi:hypothetical protein